MLYVGWVGWMGWMVIICHGSSKSNFGANKVPALYTTDFSKSGLKKNFLSGWANAVQPLINQCAHTPTHISCLL